MNKIQKLSTNLIQRITKSSPEEFLFDAEVDDLHDLAFVLLFIGFMFAIVFVIILLCFAYFIL